MNKWNESTSNWDPIYWPTTIGMTVGRGYIVAAPGSFGTATFAGTLNTGTQGPYTLNHSSGTYKGWNLEGNPFPSSIAFASLTRSNVDGGAYVWKPNYNAPDYGGNYVVYVTGGYTDPWGYGTFDGNIAPEQAFFVHVTSGSSGLLSIPNTARIHGGTFLKGAPADALTLTANGNGIDDAAMVVFRPQATTGFDPEYDAYKLFGSSNAPQLYFIAGDDNLSINTLPDVSVHPVIPVGYTVGVSGENTITVSGMESFTSGVDLYLEDLLTSRIQDLNMNPVYTFTAAPGQPAHRFNLHFAAVGINDTKNYNDITIYSNDKTIYVNLNEAMQGDIIVYNILGMEVGRKQITGNSLNKLDLNLSTGYYVVQVLGNSKSMSNKVFIR